MPSKFVKEIIFELKNNPENFRDYAGQGVIRINGEFLRVFGYGNTRMLSVMGIKFGDRDEVPLLWIDKFLLEVAIKRWYKNANIKMLLK